MYLNCTSPRRFVPFVPFIGSVESTTYVLSIRKVGSNPTLSAIINDLNSVVYSKQNAMCTPFVPGIIYTRQNRFRFCNIPMMSERLQVGHTYEVNLEDCCLELHFTARLTRISRRSGDVVECTDEMEKKDMAEFLDEATFDNGVVLTTCYHGEFTELIQ